MMKRLLIPLAGLALVSCDQPASPKVSPAPVAEAKPVPKVKAPARPLIELPPEPEVAAAKPGDHHRGLLAKALEEKDQETREGVVEAVAWEVMDRYPDVFQEALSKLPPESPSAQRLMAHCAVKLAVDDPDTAIAIALGLKDPQHKIEVSANLAVMMAEAHPVKAAKLVSGQIPQGSVQSEYAIKVVQLWAGQDSPGAAAWVATFPPGKVRSEGVQAAVLGWFHNDQAGLSDWLGSSSSEPVKAEAVAALAALIKAQPEAERLVTMEKFKNVDFSVTTPPPGP